MDQENPLNNIAKQTCYQQLFYGKITNQSYLDVNLQPLTRFNQDSELTTINQNNCYNTECYFEEVIYHAQVNDKIVVLEIINPQDQKRWQVQFIFENEIAQNGFWFQLHQRILVMIVVDVAGNIYVQIVKDIEKDIQYCIIGKINDINLLYQVEQILFDSEYVDENQNTASTSISFVASVAAPDRLIYVDFDINFYEQSFRISSLHQINWGSSIFDKINPFKNKVSKSNRNPIKNILRLSQNHSLIISHFEELKIFIHKPALRQYKIANIQKNFQQDDWFQQIAKIKYFDFAPRRDTNTRVGNHFLGTLIAFHNGKLQIFELDFIQKSPLNSFSNIKNLVSYNLSQNQRGQNYQDIPNFDFYLDLLHDIDINYHINSVFLLNNHFLIQSINKNSFILQFNKDDQNQYQLNQVSQSEYDSLQNQDYLNLVLTKDDLFFGVNEFSMNINIRVQNKFLQKSLDAHSKVSNVIQNIFTIQQQKNLVQSLQTLPRPKEDQFQSYIQGMKNWNLLSIATFQDDFRNLCYDIFIKCTKQNKNIFQILNDILIENYDLIIYLKQYFKYEDDQANLLKQISSLLRSIDNFLNEFSNDNNLHYVLNKPLMEIQYQINIQFDGIRKFMIPVFNILISKILLLLLPTQNDVHIINFLNSHERDIRNLVGIVYFVDQRDSLSHFLLQFSEGEEINIFQDVSQNIFNIINQKISLMINKLNNEQVPLILNFLYDQKFYNSTQNLIQILNLHNPFVQYLSCLCYSNLGVEDEFIQNIVQLSNDVNYLDEADFQKGPWYNQYYQKDVYIQSKLFYQIFSKVIENKLTPQERLIVLLLKNNEINDKSKYQIAERFFREVIEEDNDPIAQYKNKIMQQTLFRALFDSALNLKKDQEVLRLLRRKELLRDGFDAFSITQQRVSLMEQFINTYFSNFRYEDLMDLDLDPYILKEIFYHLKGWNYKNFHKEYQSVYRNLENVSLKQISSIFFKQSELLKSRNLYKESIQILYSFFDFLCLLREEDSRTKSHFQLILLEQINIICIIIHQFNEQTRVQDTWNSKYIFIQCYDDLNNQKFSDDEIQNINCDLIFLNIQNIQNIVLRKLEIELYVLESYDMKLDELDDLENCLIFKEDFAKLIQLWSTGKFQEAQFLTGVQIMVNVLKDKNPAALVKFLTQIIRNNGLQKERSKVLKLLVHSYLVKKISSAIFTFDQFINAFDLKNDLFSIVQIMADFNLKIMNSQLLESKLTDLMKKRNIREVNQVEAEFLNLIKNYDQERLFSPEIVKILKSQEFLQERVF